MVCSAVIDVDSDVDKYLARSAVTDVDEYLTWRVVLLWPLMLTLINT